MPTFVSCLLDKRCATEFWSHADGAGVTEGLTTLSSSCKEKEGLCVQKKYSTALLEFINNRTRKQYVLYSGVFSDLSLTLKLFKKSEQIQLRSYSRIVRVTMYLTILLRPSTYLRDVKGPSSIKADSLWM